jgi:hypothetical protein
MSEKPKKGMEAIDVAQLLQNKIDFSSWKGDEHIKGVWFNDSHGCTLNKVMAIRVKCTEVHKEKMAGNNLFYSLSAIHDRWDDDEDGSPMIIDQFPFVDMKVKPKKHFLLFDKEAIGTKEIESLFELKESHAIIRLKPQVIVDALGSVNNKRDRERSFARLDLQDSTMSVRVLKRKSNKSLITLAKTSVNCELLASPISQTDAITADINAHTLLYLLNLFYDFSSVAIFITRDRIMITSENCTPNVEVVISRLKTG